MSDKLKEILNNIPENPGVYIMKKKTDIIYIGKAKNLKNRVNSYFNREHDSLKTRELVKNVENIEYFICNSEVDAFILENNLIKKHAPKYNILLKDEKTYPYIKISKEEFPTLKIIRTTKYLDTQNGVYFGPYPLSIYNLKKTLFKIFKIRDCNRDMSKFYSKPCLKYYMHFCLGPCVNKEIKYEYENLVKGIIKLLKGNGNEYIKELKNKMKLSSEKMEFEEAIKLRGQIAELENIVTEQITQYEKRVDEDYFLYQREENLFFITVLKCREGKIIDKNSLKIDLTEKIYQEDELILEILITYYGRYKAPKNIVFKNEILNSNKLEEFLEKTQGFKVKIDFPKIKSRKKEILSMGELNLIKDIENYYKKRDVLEEGLKKIYKKLSLRNFPRRIECFDISNTSGKDAVASMSSAIEGKTTPKEYRKFKITTKNTPDDFQMMREVITRRYTKLSENEYPDAILIDGGLGQINAVGKILIELGIEKKIDLLSIAKKEELIYKYGESQPYIFSKSDEALKIFQRLRDEAHRFGVTYHRKLRSKRVISSELDKLHGIGDKRKKMLLNEFGTVNAVFEASLDSLKKIVPSNIAENIKLYYNKNKVLKKEE